MINVRQKGVDGITAYHRVRGREYAKRLVPFGELVEVHFPLKGPEIKVPEDESLERRGVALGATGTALRTSR